MKRFRVSRLTLVEKDACLATAVVTVSKAIFLTNIRLIQARTGIMVEMPKRKNAQGAYEDIFFAVDRETRDELRAVVLRAYRLALVQKGATP